MTTDADTAPAAEPAARSCPSCGAPLRHAGARWCGTCGAEVSAEEPGTDLVPVAEEPARQPGGGWWTRRRAFLAGGVALAVAGLIGGYLMWQSSGDRHAEGPVLQYLSALADGDGPAAAKLLGKDAPDSPMWESGALADGYQGPEDVEVTRVDYGGATRVDQRDNRSYATVFVSYQLGGETVDQIFDMDRDDDGGLERPWSIVRADMGMLDAGDGEVTVAGTTASGQLRVPPGVYTVAAPGNALFKPVSDEVTVEPLYGDELGESAELPVELRDDVGDAVDGLIRDRIDECAAADKLDWDHCPWVFDDVTLRDWATTANWTVEKYPEVKVVLDGTAASVEVVTPGEVSARRTIIDGSKRTETADVVPTGSVTADGDKLTWTYEPPDD